MGIYQAWKSINSKTWFDKSPKAVWGKWHCINIVFKCHKRYGQIRYDLLANNSLSAITEINTVAYRGRFDIQVTQNPVLKSTVRRNTVLNEDTTKSETALTKPTDRKSPSTCKCRYQFKE